MNVELLQKHLVQWAKAVRLTSQNAVMPACRAFGLTHQQFTILAELSRTDGLSAGELSDRACILRSNFASVAHKLEQRGLLKQEKSSADRRYSVLQLTEEGAKLVDEMLDWLQSRYAAAFTDIPEEVFDDLIRGAAASEYVALRIEQINLACSREEQQTEAPV